MEIFGFEIKKRIAANSIEPAKEKKIKSAIKKAMVRKFSKAKRKEDK